MWEIRAFALEAGAAEAASGLMQWDTSFWAERLREAKYELKEEDLRPYFQLPAVIDGMFELASKLFGIKVRTTRSCLPPHPTHFESSIIELNDVL